MKKLFISQPMKGKSDEDILAERAKAIRAARDYFNENVEVIDSFFRNAPPDETPLCLLGKALQLLSTADVVYFCPGWENYRGCKIEYECAIKYGIDILESFGEF